MAGGSRRAVAVLCGIQFVDVLGDRYGHRRVLLLGCAAFALVSLVGASAQEMVQLVTARGLQGAAAATSVPSALRLLLDASPEPDDRRGALAAWSASGAAAGAPVQVRVVAGDLVGPDWCWSRSAWASWPARR